jgi:hypothetical protein
MNVPETTGRLLASQPCVFRLFPCQILHVFFHAGLVLIELVFVNRHRGDTLAKSIAGFDREPAAKPGYGISVTDRSESVWEHVEHHQDDQDHQNQTQTAARAVSPVFAIAVMWQSAEQQQEHDNE